jgi:hypothetical protein
MRVDEQEQLLHTFKITPADLDANRLGRLGTRERRRMVIWCSIGVALGVGFGVWMVYEGARSELTPPGVPAQDWIIPVAIGLIVLLFVLVAARAYLLTMRRAVECVTGPVSMSLVRAGRSSVLKLQVAGRALALPTPAHASHGVIAAYEAVLTDRPYHVYFLGRRVLAMEPAAESLLDRSTHEPVPVPVAGRRPYRLNWFSKACVALVMLATLGTGAGGVYLGIVQLTGTQAKATVSDCVQGTEQDAYSTVTTYDCTGSWTVGGSLVGGNGQVVVGTIDGVGPTDVGKTVDVRLAGGEAYTDSLVTPILLICLGFPFSALCAFALFKARRRH